MNNDWPSLPLEEWNSTCRTLHMWTQMVGKIRLKLSPLVNHWWNVPLYVSPRGLTTSTMPYGELEFELEFDFIDHLLELRLSDGRRAEVVLRAVSVAQFYAELRQALDALDIYVRIWTMPVEIAEPIPFAHDVVNFDYQPEYAWRCWRVLALSARVFTEFRGRFLGKSSPVHFFWGSFDLAVTRFNGELAPLRPDADSITREGYSHANISCGWWPGDSRVGASYYAYAAPEPDGYSKAALRVPQAYYSREMSLQLLPYDAVRTADEPAEMLMQFLQETYAAAADLAGWDRLRLERQ